MSKYGRIAILAATLAAEQGEKKITPDDAWKQSANEIFPNQPASRDKGCPRCAFLGLAGYGLIIGIPSGDYTKSQDNKRYAIAGVTLLKKEQKLEKEQKLCNNLCNNPNEMWHRVMLCEQKSISHNNQMDVVAALWIEGYIEKNHA